MARREVVLSEVPVGTPVGQSRAVLAGHGLACAESGPEELYLLCKATGNSRFLATEVVAVELYHSRGTVMAAELSRSIAGP